MYRQSFAASLILLAGAVARADDAPLEERFATVVQPFLKSQCLSCHGPRKQEAKLDLSGEASVAAIVKNHRVWDLVLERLEADEMPPEDAPKRPTKPERQAIVDWIRTLRDREALKNAGDPGPVLARRLSNAEYDNTIRDLTGFDIRPTREFPVDPANEAGFDTSGESLTMSPALLKKYLAAARKVSDHLVLKPDGFAFAPDPAVTDTDRDKYCVRRIIAFYDRHKVDYPTYFLAAWRYRNRALLGKPDATLDDMAAEAGISRRYLSTVWSLLTDPTPEGGPTGQLKTLWNELPDDAGRIEDARRGAQAMRDLIIKVRSARSTRETRLKVQGSRRGASPSFSGITASRPNNTAFPPGVPSSAGSRDPGEASLRQFYSVFPDAFFVADRAPYFDPKSPGQGRPLTAGFHLMQGYFRDDDPLRALVLDEPAQRELDTLWEELDFITHVPIRQYKDFIFFERAEPPQFFGTPDFDFARSEDKDATSEPKIQQLKAAYLAKARKNGANEQAVQAIETYFSEMSARIRKVEDGQRAAEPSHLAALVRFAGRAYRRPLSEAEREDLLGFYQALRSQDGLNHEDAIRDSVASVLMSPNFSYRADRAEPGEQVQPLSGHALASRLSYFLWASMPDEELLSLASSGELRKPEVLISQSRRMLKDAKARGLATEFLANWLDFRRFEEHNSVDRERFPSFTNELRQAMYEEPIRYFADLAARDGSVLDLLESNHTFVNPILARHYGMPISQLRPDEWVRFDNAREFGRGGLPPMSVFLTANSPGLRTSPVKRGYWVVRRMLGEHIPAPPPVVPELPKDEAKSGDLTLPQLLAQHRADKNCASCHQRFDSIGLVFEGYGPIGERRDRDLAGRPVEVKATFPDGSAGDGLDGLRRYLAGNRKDDFIDNLCRKLLSYALGRGLILADETTIKAMKARLATDGHRFGGLIETILTSPQFVNKRGRDDPRN